MTTVESLIDSLNNDPCHVFWGQCVAWAEINGAAGEGQLRDYIDAGGSEKTALSILCGISRQCEHELNLDIPKPVQEVLPNGSIRCSTPMAPPSKLMPDRFSHLEDLFSELRDQ